MSYDEEHTVDQCDKCLKKVGEFNLYRVPFMYLDKNDIKEGLRNGYMKFIEELPGDVYDVCAANFRWHAKKAGL